MQLVWHIWYILDRLQCLLESAVVLLPPLISQRQLLVSHFTLCYLAKEKSAPFPSFLVQDNLTIFTVNAMLILELAVNALYVKCHFFLIFVID